MAARPQAPREHGVLPDLPPAARPNRTQPADPADADRPRLADLMSGARR